MYMLQIALPEDQHVAIDITKIVLLKWYDGTTTICCEGKNAILIDESLAEYQERVLKVENMKNQCHCP